MTKVGGSKDSAGSKKRKKKKKNVLDGELKRQLRMEKNRESASASRLRRKLYIENLEAQCRQLTAERAEMAAKLEQLAAENAALRSGNTGHTTYFTPSRAAGTTLLACLACVALIGGPRTGFGPAMLSSNAGVSSHRVHGRALQGLVPSIARDVIPVRSQSMSELQPLPTKSVDVVVTPKRDEPHSMVDDWLKDYEHRLALLGINASGVSNNGDKSHTGESSSSTALAPLSDDSMLDTSSGLFIEPGRPPVWRLPPDLKNSLFRGVDMEPTSSYIFCSEVSMVAAEKPHRDGQPRVSVLLPTPAGPGDFKSKNSTGDSRTLALLRINALVTGSQSQVFHHNEFDTTNISTPLTA